jgi:hypothetical protein
MADKIRRNQYSSIKLKEMENTIKIKFADDGSEFFVPNAPMAIVRMMRDNARFASDEDLEAYMVGFVDRYRIDSGNNVRCDSYENFVADLKEFGFIREIATENPANFL